MSDASHLGDFSPYFSDEDHELPITSPDENIRSIERKNLLSLCKLSIKSLIDVSLRIGRQLVNPEFPPLLDVFISLELLLRHGLKG